MRQAGPRRSKRQRMVLQAPKHHRFEKEAEL
jgi:hypothetical protein